MINLILVLILATSLIYYSEGQQEKLPRIQINKQTGQFIADDGSVRIFHGLNLVDKKRDLIKITDEQMDIMKEWGMNFVRVGFLWNLVEPQPGQYNETYLQELDHLINRLESKGLYAMLDMHQDLWSNELCGHGIPNFYGVPYDTEEYISGDKAFPAPVAKQSTSPTHPGKFNNNPTENCRAAGQGWLGWATTYMTYGISAASQRLYDNDSNFLTKFGDFWEHIASRFHSKTGVLGYELMNEPWLGDVPLSFKQLFGKHWNLWYPGIAEKKNLHPMNQYLHSRIRQVDDDTIIFYEPSSGGNILGMLPVGFKTGPGGKDYDDRQALSYHVYCPFIQTDIPLQPDGSSFWAWIQRQLAKKGCQILNRLQYSIRGNDVKRIGGGGIMTEFGAIPSNDDGIGVINMAMEEMDKMLHGWAYWYIVPSRDADEKKVKAITRTYAQVVSGNPHKMSFDPESKSFELIYEPKETKHQTTIYASTNLHYQSGLDCEIIPAEAATCDYDAQKNTVTIVHSDQISSYGKLTVRISSK